MILRPFFRYYGGKWRAVHAGMYPQPRFGKIVEPFAGSAGYSLNFPLNEVTLIDRDPTIIAIWKWLIAATPEEVRSVPLVDSVDDLPGWVPFGARSLIGFSMNAATSSPRRTLSASARKLREQGRKFYGWTHEMRERVATQVPHVKHWQAFEGDCSLAAAPYWSFLPRTWFIDPPYESAGKHYRYGSECIEYIGLAEWCRSRPGHVIVCEQSGASWLPFRDIGATKAGPRSRVTAEAVWP